MQGPSFETVPNMDDSGFDSEDKHSTLFEDIPIKTAFNREINDEDFLRIKERSDGLEVSFKNSKDLLAAPTNSNNKYLQTPQTSSETEPTDSNTSRAQPPNTCRVLQRKLELKVERAKRNYSQYQEEKAKQLQSANLIPIERLSIPGEVPLKPLVDYKSESSDEAEEISFFPTKSKSLKRHKHLELTDTFSIQEMTIDSDQESDRSGSPTLELLLPNPKTNIFERLKNFLWCSCCR